MLEIMWRKRNPTALLVGMKAGTAIRRVWRLFKKLKIELLYDLAIPLVGIQLDKTIILKDTWASMFFVALFEILKI